MATRPLGEPEPPAGAGHTARDPDASRHGRRNAAAGYAAARDAGRQRVRRRRPPSRKGEGGPTRTGRQPHGYFFRSAAVFMHFAGGCSALTAAHLMVRLLPS